MSADPGRPNGPAPAGGAPSSDGAALQARLDALRDRIADVDGRLIALVGERRALALEIGGVKEALGLPVMDPAREAAVVRRAAERAREAGVDEELVRDVVWRIIASARQAQEGRSTWGPPGDPPPTV